MAPLVQRSRIKCRICVVQIYRQNYKTHLQRCHPDEDSSDLSEYGVQRLPVNFFARNNNSETSSNRDNAATVEVLSKLHLLHF